VARIIRSSTLVVNPWLEVFSAWSTAWRRAGGGEGRRG